MRRNMVGEDKLGKFIVNKRRITKIESWIRASGKFETQWEDGSWQSSVIYFFGCCLPTIAKNHISQIAVN